MEEQGRGPAGDVSLFGGRFPPQGLGHPSQGGRGRGARGSLLSWVGGTCARVEARPLAPSVRGFRAPVRRGSGLRVGSGAPSPGLRSVREAGPAPPTPGDTHPPISRRSSGSSRSSRSRRNRGRRHPRPRSRPTPSAPPAGRPEIASSASRPRHREMASRLGRRATPRRTPERGADRPPGVPSALSGGKTNSSPWARVT